MRQLMLFFCLFLSADALSNTASYWLKKGVDSVRSHKPSASQANEPKVARVDSRSVELDYGFFQVNYSCEHRGFNYLHYTTVPDQGSHPRYEPFHQEPALDKVNCPAQKTTAGYKQLKGQPLYHRGHGNHQNIWDHDRGMMALTNRMTNVVPHNGEQNTAGLWRELEKRVECARDRTTVTVYLGNDWGSDASNDHFVRSHGVTTPDYLWRVHVYASHPNEAHVWYIPNDPTAKPKDALKYRITLSELRQKTSDDFDWPLPSALQDATRVDPYTKLTCSLK